jgi:hypothetical protein
MTGKISSLPRHIRDQLHLRLDDAQPETSILPWLNSLPETQALLQDRFDGAPVSAENLYQYRKRAFRRWQTRQAALQFISQSGDDDEPDAAQLLKLSAAPIIDRIVNSVLVRLAAAAQNGPAADDPQAEARELRALVEDTVALRRGELVSRRIGIQQQHLDSLKAKSAQELERLFWEWTKRPEIVARLFPDRDPDKVRRQVVRMLDHHFLGARNLLPSRPRPRTRLPHLISSRLRPVKLNES